jgi:hypothetical protein
MTEHKIAVPVLARFPDVNDVMADAPPHKAKGLGLLASSGRLIGQAMSIKLLAGTALFLIVGAVLPFCIGTKTPADPLPAHDSLVTAKPKSPKVATQPADASDEAAALIANRPAVRVVPTKEPSSAPAAPASEISNKSQADPTADAPQMSQWPAAKTGSETSSPDVSRPTSVRQAEYEADAGATPGSNRENRR